MLEFDSYLQVHRDRHLAELTEFLAIPSVSALSAHKDDVAHAADWLLQQLHVCGMQNVTLLPTPGHPAVYGEWLQEPGAPTALVYGHYDVQPVDPLGLWTSPPFAPVVRDGCMFARGASDDKGQVFIHLKSIQALLQTAGRLPLNVKFLIEGEEEVGSRHLPELIEQEAGRLQSDVVVISDSALFAPGLPAVIVGLRGLTALEITLRGARGDLHSGEYGGAVQNPLHALAQLLASLRSPDGRIQIEGFYDQVAPLSAAERAEWAQLPHDDAAYRQELGVTELFGEPGFSTLERKWARPTVEVNGLWGGFTGEGTKTVLPAVARAKITCRLVPDQDPGRIGDLVEAHLRRHLPPGVTLAVHRERGGARPVVTSPDHPAVLAAKAALAEVYGRDPVATRIGGSIPVVETFSARLKAPVVLLGFGLPGENIHAPDEHFHLENFDAGLRTLGRFWQRLARAL